MLVHCSINRYRTTYYSLANIAYKHSKDSPGYVIQSWLCIYKSGDEYKVYLSKMHIEGFRGIEKIDIDFQKQLNIIIGENNSGKTSILDALRICFEYGNQHKTIFVSPDDFYFNKSKKEYIDEISFDCLFSLDNPDDEGEAALFYEFMTLSPDGKKRFELHHRYTLDKRNGRERVRSSVWGGDNQSQILSQYASSLLDCMYVDPLRDADRYLTPSNGSQIGSLLRQLVPDTEKQNEMSQRLEDVIKSDEDWNDLLAKGTFQINEHLKEATFISIPEKIDMDLMPFSFKGISNSAFLRLPWPGLTKEESKQFSLKLYQNGLGLNNIIYICTVLGNIKSIRLNDAETYMALLIEEPESHLHPQLQNTLFSYLNKLSNIRVQVFLTSHSPTITAKTDLNTLSVIKRACDPNVEAFSVSKSKLSDNDKKYLSKFLDVTKSQLFFANGILLVEGISEALLMESFSKIMGIQSNKGEKYSLSRNGIEIVNVDGVAFEPFAKLFNNTDPHLRLNARAAILTDDDRKTISSDDICDRAQKALKLESGMLKTFLAKKTFEYELVAASKNNITTILAAYKTIHPQNADTFAVNEDCEVTGVNFVERIKKDGTGGKSEFAQALAIYFDDHPEFCKSFVVPDYIKRAFNWLVEGI